LKSYATLVYGEVTSWKSSWELVEHDFRISKTLQKIRQTVSSEFEYMVHAFFLNYHSTS